MMLGNVLRQRAWHSGEAASVVYESLYLCFHQPDTRQHIKSDLTHRNGSFFLLFHAFYCFITRTTIDWVMAAAGGSFEPPDCFFFQQTCSFVDVVVPSLTCSPHSCPGLRYSVGLLVLKNGLETPSPTQGGSFLSFHNEK